MLLFRFCPPPPAQPPKFELACASCAQYLFTPEQQAHLYGLLTIKVCLLLEAMGALSESPQPRQGLH